VFSTQDERMSSAVKVLCLYLADHMGERDRKVSVPRQRIADALGIHKARVGERLTKAVEAGFLDRVSRGHNGRTAVYQGTRPLGSSVQRSGSLPRELRTAPPDATGVRRAVPYFGSAEREPAELRTALLDANTEADLFARGTDRDVGNDDETLDRPNAYGLTVCDCHGFLDCSSLNPSSREESA
jgi:DNA-binding Lrp family transcriptional regulator